MLTSSEKPLTIHSVIISQDSLVSKIIATDLGANIFSTEENIFVTISSLRDSPGIPLMPSVPKYFFFIDLKSF